MALLRIVDPENKSCTLDDAAIVTPIESIIEVFALAYVPVACVQGNWLMGVAPILIYMVGLIVVSIPGVSLMNPN
jgi:ESS family glutamate:Na+ symporter